jgi:hypothetical protein
LQHLALKYIPQLHWQQCFSCCHMEYLFDTTFPFIIY